MSAGISPVSTRTRCHNIASGKSSAPPPFGSDTFTSPRRNDVCDQELRKPSRRDGPPVLRPALLNRLAMTSACVVSSSA